MLESYYPVVGGMEAAARMLVRGLIARGIEVMVITRRVRGDLEKAEVGEGASIYRVSPVGTGHFSRWVMVLTSLPLLVTMNRRYDVIFVPGFRTLGISAVLVSRLLHKHCILQAENNGEMSGEFFAGGLERVHLPPSARVVKFMLAIRNAILRRADSFVSISLDIRAELISNQVPSDKVTLIPHAVDINRFQPAAGNQKVQLRQRLGLPQGKTIVVFTGRLVSWKGLPLLIKVWERIHHNHPHAFLLLVGSGGTDIYNCEDELKEFVRSNYLQDSVGLTGDVRNVHEYLQASDIFVFPTEKDAFGISLIEAMACGLPVVAARTGAIKEIVTPGQDGLMVEPGDFQQLYAALDKLLDDNSLAMSLGAAARRTAMERYSDEVIIEKYIEVFQSFSASAQHAVANA